jgi:hypothetical protein
MAVRYTLGRKEALLRFCDDGLIHARLPYIEETIAQEEITIGIIPPIKECVAIAHERKPTLAILKRRQGESLAQLLNRLELAIALAHFAETFHGRSILPFSKTPSAA